MEATTVLYKLVLGEQQGVIRVPSEHPVFIGMELPLAGKTLSIAGITAPVFPSGHRGPYGITVLEVDDESSSKHREGTELQRAYNKGQEATGTEAYSIKPRTTGALRKWLSDLEGKVPFKLPVKSNVANIISQEEYAAVVNVLGYLKQKSELPEEAVNAWESLGMNPAGGHEKAFEAEVISGGEPRKVLIPFGVVPLPGTRLELGDNDIVAVARYVAAGTNEPTGVPKLFATKVVPKSDDAKKAAIAHVSKPH